MSAVTTTTTPPNTTTEQQQQHHRIEPGQFEKYLAAAEIANFVLKVTLEKCVEGASIFSLSKDADTLIRQKLEKVYTKKENGEKVRKGIAFPTCVNVNEILGHCSPMEDKPEQMPPLKNGDFVKVNLGVHVGELIAIVGHTTVVGGLSSVRGRGADVLMAAWTAAEAVVRLMRVGNTNDQVTNAIIKAANAYHCTPVHGTLTHEMHKGVIDGVRVIMGGKQVEEKVESFTFEAGQVFGVDILMSSGEGKLKETTFETTIYKRELDVTHPLKTAKSRQFYGLVATSYGSMPFNIREIEDKQVAHMGVAECARNGLISAFPVFSERSGVYTAGLQFTVILQDNQTRKISGLPLAVNEFKSEYKVEDEELKAILSKGIFGAVSKKKKSSQTTTTDNVVASV